MNYNYLIINVDVDLNCIAINLHTSEANDKKCGWTITSKSFWTKILPCDLSN